MDTEEQEQELESVRLRLTNTRIEDSSILITNPISDTSSSTSSLQIMEADQRSCLRKFCVILLALALWRIMVIGKMDPREKLKNLGIVTFCCLMFYVLENLFFCANQQHAMNEHKKRLFHVLNGISGLYFLITVRYFNEEEDLTKYLLIAAPCLDALITMKYAQLSTLSSSEKLARLCVNLQIILITAKFLGYTTGWMNVFLPLALLFVVHQIYGSFFLVKASIKFFKGLEIQNPLFLKYSLKMAWNVVHYGLLFLIFGIFIDLCNQTEGTNLNKIIKILLVFVESYSGLFLGYGFIFIKIAREVINREGNLPSIIESKKEEYSIVPQEGLCSSSFLRISPTYFVKAEEIQGEENFRQIEEHPFSCYICEEKKADIILINCGHGGMCKNCVLLSLNKTNCCMQCRKPMTSIYQITKEEKDSGKVDARKIFNIIFN